MSVPSGYTKLGTIGYSDKGDYSSAITYSYMNVVHYNGNVYFSKQDNNTNNLPTNTSWWGIMIQGGATDMTGATSSTDGVHGLVPAPLAGDEDKFLKGDGTWGEGGGSLPNTIAVSEGDAASFPVSGTNYIAIGSNSNVTHHSIAIGVNSEARYGIIIGHSAKGFSSSVSIGTNSYSSTNSISVGRNSNAYDSGGISIGHQSRVGSDNGNSMDSIAIGTNSKCDMSFASTIVGANSISYSGKNVIIGSYSSIGNNSAQSIIIGADIHISEQTNTVCLGYMANCSESNMIQLGNASTLSKLACKVQLTVGSDERDKTDITPLEDNKSLDFINKLNPVQFVYNHRELYKNEYKKYNDDLPDDYIPEPTYDEEGNIITPPERPINPIWQETEDIRSKYPIYDYDKNEWEAGTKKGERKRVGLLSQEVQQALIDVYGSTDVANIVDDSWHDLTQEEKANIPQGAENSLTMAYSNLIPMMIGAIKELSARVEELEGNNS